MGTMNYLLLTFLAPNELELNGLTPIADKETINFCAVRPTAGVTGKGGIWREKPPDAEPAVGARIPKVWANARTCPVHAVLGAANL